MKQVLAIFDGLREQYLRKLIEVNVCVTNETRIKTRTNPRDLRYYYCEVHNTKHYTANEQVTQILRSVEKGDYLKFNPAYNLTTDEFGMLKKKHSRTVHPHYTTWFPYEHPELRKKKKKPAVNRTGKSQVQLSVSQVKETQVQGVQKRSLPATELAPGVIFPQTNQFPDEFIVPPETVHPDLLIEYFYCGRKLRFLAAEDAANHKDTTFTEKNTNSVYKCAYGDHYHIGRTGERAKKGNQAYGKDVKAGFYWYKSSVKRANRFMWAIMNFD